MSLREREQQILGSILTDKIYSKVGINTKHNYLRGMYRGLSTRTQGFRAMAYFFRQHFRHITIYEFIPNQFDINIALDDFI